WIEVVRFGPMKRISAGVWVRRDDGIEACVPFAKDLPLRRQRRNAAGIGRDGPEQLHDKTVQASERGTIRRVGVILHRPGKAGADGWVRSVRLQTSYHVVEHIAPLAERQEVVETLEDDIITVEVLAESPVLDPVVDEGCLGMMHAAVDQILYSQVEPVFEEWS